MDTWPNYYIYCGRRALQYYSMVEQTLNPSSINLRSKGLTTSAGKLHRGCVKDATSKLSIGSIPATYESIIYRNQRKKAFGSSEQRFHQKGQPERILSNGINMQSSLVPKSQEYFRETYCSSTSTKKDFNKEGYGAFISKVERGSIRKVKTPGPTHYYRNQQNNAGMEAENQRKCKTRALKIRNKQNRAGRIKRQSPEKTKDTETPGPGFYLFEKKQVWTKVNKGWKSSFETKVGREGYIPASVSPGPGFYHSLNEQKKEKGSESKKLKQNDGVSKLEKNIISSIEEQISQEPGPGWYNHDIPTFKPLYERIKMSGSFMTPIFERKRRPNPTPGPTFYGVKRMYEDMKPKLIESTAFMSETKRQAFKPVQIQGPSFTPCELPGPKNFHFNIKDEWLS